MPAEENRQHKDVAAHNSGTNGAGSGATRCMLNLNSSIGGSILILPDWESEWFIRKDPGNVGLAEKWWEEPLQHPRPWKPAIVPQAWQKNEAIGIHYHYLAWYRRLIQMPEDWGWSHTRLVLEAVATEARVWANGVEVARTTPYSGDYLPTCFDLSPVVRRGAAIDLLIRVDEQLGHITKGFHDMLSWHHGGLWQSVYLHGAGQTRAAPDGVHIRADGADGSVRAIVELEHIQAGSMWRVRIEGAGPRGKVLADSGLQPLDAASDAIASMSLRVDPFERWSHTDEHPALYLARMDLVDARGQMETHAIRFAFRTIEVRGAQVLLNGSPIQVRGVLHWGHEPAHLAPAPPPEQVRCEFKYLKSLGFNTVCLCMWYPPRSFFDIADETGMFIWQEHPIWHAPMDDEFIEPYQRHFIGFMRRDRNHPSVIIVSSTCEHPSYHPELARWWWAQAHEMLPDKLLQVQTASFAWSDPEQTDLYDEHTYDNSNRWVHYLEDLQETLAQLPIKPFIMGETILFTSWPDFEAIDRRIEQLGSDWWKPAYDSSGRHWEAIWSRRYGTETVNRFRRQADRHHCLGRKFQIECFRCYPNHAGLVMNHIRDVPGATCGFMDDADHWRFTSEQFAPFLADAPLIIQTPDQRRSFAITERSLLLHLRVPNFGPAALDHLEARFILHDPQNPSADAVAQSRAALSHVHPGEVADVAVELDLSESGLCGDRPVRLRLSCSAPNLRTNEWDLWFMPRVYWRAKVQAHQRHRGDEVICFAGLPFEAADAAPDELEQGYSRGFGLPVKRWVNRLPFPPEVMPGAPTFECGDDLTEPDARATVVVTHRMTEAIIDFMACRGGAVILLASKAPGGLGTVYEWFFGQRPLVIEKTKPGIECAGGHVRSPLGEGDSEWVVDLLGFDLTRTYARMIPVEDLGIADAVDPLVRLVYTHDADRVRFFDMLFQARVGRAGGRLMVSCFDHRDPAGQYLLERMADSIRNVRADEIGGELEESFLRVRTYEVLSGRVL